MSSEITSLHELAHQLTGGANTPYRTFVRLEDLTVEVRANKPELQAAVRGYFCDFLAPLNSADLVVRVIDAPTPKLDLPFKTDWPAPGKTKIKNEYVDFPDGRLVRKCLTGFHAFFGPGISLACGPCLANMNQTVNFVVHRFIQWQLERKHLVGHAAAVSLSGKAFAIAGLSGRGKSTLALHMLHRGLDFISNDRILVARQDDGHVVRGVPKLPRVNPGTILTTPGLEHLVTNEQKTNWQSLAPDDLWHLEEKYDVFIDQCYGPGRFKLHAALMGLVILTWNRDGGPPRLEEVRLEDRADLLEALRKPVGVFFAGKEGQEPPDQSPEAYLRLLQGCPVYEIAGGIDFSAAAEMLIEKLQTSEICRQTAQSDA
jgi:HprK-related kinase B